jgi:hypothetical protein
LITALLLQTHARDERSWHEVRPQLLHHLKASRDVFVALRYPD